MEPTRVQVQDFKGFGARVLLPSLLMDAERVVGAAAWAAASPLERFRRLALGLADGTVGNIFMGAFSEKHGPGLHARQERPQPLFAVAYEPPASLRGEGARARLAGASLDEIQALIFGGSLTLYPNPHADVEEMQAFLEHNSLGGGGR